MSMLKKFIEISLIWRLWNSLKWAKRSVRIHPTLRIGGGERLRIGRGTKIGRDSTIEIGRIGGVKIGTGCWFYRDVEIRTNGELAIGNRTTLQKGVTLNGNVKIGADCLFAPNIFISSGTHIFDCWPEIPIRQQERLLAAELLRDKQRENLRQYDRPVVIGEDCWLGINTVIMPGVTIGRGCIIGANSVVTKSVEPYSIVAGLPAKKISSRLHWNPSCYLDATSIGAIPYLYEGFEIMVNEGRAFARMGARVRIALASSKARLVELNIESSSVANLQIANGIEKLVPGKNKIFSPLIGDEKIEENYILLEIILLDEGRDVNLILLSCRLLN